MSSNEPKVNSYLEFKEQMLPRIRSLGYNAIQIMAIQVRAGVCKWRSRRGRRGQEAGSVLGGALTRPTPASLAP